MWIGQNLVRAVARELVVAVLTDAVQARQHTSDSEANDMCKER